MPVLKTKLEDGTWAQVLSGGNADTVDGKHATDFASNDHTHTAEDVGAVPSAGGTMTGPLFFGDQSKNIAHAGGVLDFASGRASLRVDSDRFPTGGMKDAALLRDTGSGAEYRLYGEHNKPTAADVGAVNSNLLQNYDFTGAEIWARAGTQCAIWGGDPGPILSADTKTEGVIDGNFYHITINGTDYAVWKDDCYQKPGTGLVNQKQNVLYDAQGYLYTFDRWFVNDGYVRVSICSDSIRLLSTSSDIGATYRHKVSTPLTQQIYTLSILAKNVSGNISLIIQKNSGDYQTERVGISNGCTQVSITPNEEAIYEAILEVSPGASLDVIAIKLELGYVQTLARQLPDGSWEQIDHANYAEEMAACVQYDKDTGNYIGMTPAAIGAVSKAGDSMIGNLDIRTSSYPCVTLTNTTTQGSGIFQAGPNNIDVVSFVDGSNYRHITLLNHRESSGVETSVALADIRDGVSRVYNMYGTHNITAGTTDLAAGYSALGNDCIYQVYE